jgi:hypothetical protein
VVISDNRAGSIGWKRPIGVFDRGSVTMQRPRYYRVLLHNDDFNRREYVVKVLLKVIDNFTMEEAINCMQVLHASREFPLLVSS